MRSLRDKPAPFSNTSSGKSSPLRASQSCTACVLWGIEAAEGSLCSSGSAPRPPGGRVSGGVPFTGEPTGGVNSAQPKVGGELPTFGVPLAGAYSNHHSNKTYIALQSEAQQARRGLWAGAEIMEPAQWRKLHAADAPPTTPMHATVPSVRASEDYTCGSKRHCAQMRSCDEAYFYLSHCRVESLDRSGDGVPCKKLCGGK